MNAPSRLILLGAGGHAKVIRAVVEALKLPLKGVCDPALSDLNITHWNNLLILGDDTALKSECQNETGLINGIGQTPYSTMRQDVQKKWMATGFIFPTCIHPTAWVAPDVELGSGVQVMAGAIIQPGSQIGMGSIINTGATIDHDCNIGEFSHIAPGATLCGNVSVGKSSFIGAGATVIQGIMIGQSVILAAGATLLKNIDNNTRSFGGDDKIHIQKT